MRKRKIFRIMPTVAMMFVYPIIELLWRGVTSIWMAPVGGLCGGVVDIFDEKYKHWSVLKQSVVGSTTTTIIEFAAGVILNIWLGLNIWSYADLPFNILGQICLLYKFYWFLLMPFIIWFGNYSRWLFYRDRQKPKGPWWYYWQFLKDIERLVCKWI